VLNSALTIVGVVVHSQLVTPAPRVPLPRPAPNAASVVTHSNRVPAGVLRGRELTLALDVVEGAWKPEGDDDPEVPILAFAEAGKAPTNPGPLIRVPRGTTVKLTLRNRSDSNVFVGGLRGGTPLETDTITLPAGTTRTISYRLDAAGTYMYYGAFAGTSFEDRLWKDSQLAGAVVVDPPGGSTKDHIFVLTEWFHPYDDGRPFESAMTINGKAWPHTERLTLPQGDSVRFRVVNALAIPHPLHLHGFYYRLESRNPDGREVPIPRSRQVLSNTDLIAPAETYTLSFAPTTPGNWIWHCHFAFHADDVVTLSGSPRDSSAIGHAAHSSGTKPTHSMRGLVIGMHVTPSPGYTVASADSVRTMHLYVQKDPGRLITGAAAIGFALKSDDKEPARDSVALPAPVLELRRGQPVRIVVHNNLDEPTAVHWHGLEIESFPDGVPHWSGMGDKIFPQIAPNDSFVAAFTPPRSGTFPYHSHLNDRNHILSGMYGALLVTDTPRDPRRDHVIVAGGGGPVVTAKVESPYALVNGNRFTRPLRLTVGETHRLRIVSIHPDYAVAFTLRNDSTIARWRWIAKDGATRPQSLATMGPANVVMGPGETNDFEFTPTAPGEWTLDVRSAEPGWYIPLRVIVEPRAAKRER
jgi:FtsP/CotA-like multicopper oxidase with cupredoxin domain